MRHTRFEPHGRASDTAGRTVGFTGETDAELERFAASELAGVVERPRLLARVGLWVTLAAREPCCRARILLRIRRRSHDDERVSKQVLRAAGQSRGIGHPAVLPVRRFGCSGELLWVTLPDKGGRFLDHWFGEGRGLSQSSALEFLRLVAAPLSAAHARGVVHGALTASAFHRDREGTIRLCAPGIDVPILRADLAEGIDTEAAACAAPELRADRAPVAASDQYAVAAILVRHLTGRFPGPAGELPEEGVPDSWSQALRRSLAPDPAERFDDVEQLWQALDPRLVRVDTERAERAELGADEPALDEPEYLPPAFRPRRPAGRRLVDPDASGSPPLGVDQVLFSDGRWDDERWDLENPARRGVSTRRRLADVVVLLLLSSVLGFFYVRNPEELLSGLRTTSALAQRWAGMGDATQLDEAAVLLPIDPPATAPTTASPDDARPLPAEPPERPGQEGDPSAETDSLEPPGDLTPAIVAAADAPAGPGPAEPDPAPAPQAAARDSLAATGQPEPVGTPRVVEPLAPGRLSLQTYPWGTVYVDGEYVGTTPVLDLPVPAGPHVIRVERADYEAYVRNVSVQPGGTLRLTGITLAARGR